MINYIKAELYRNFNRAYLWVYTAIIAALVLAVNIIINISHAGNGVNLSLSNVLEITNSMMIIPVFLVAGMIDTVIAEENKNKTMKNVIALGIDRSKLILSKFIAAVILACIAAVIILAVLYGSGALLLGLGDNFNIIFLDHFKRLAASFPLWMAAIAVGIFLNIIINNSTVCAFVYAIVFLMTPLVTKFFIIFVSDKFKHVYNILITTQLGKLSARVVASHDFITSIIIGFIYIIVFLAFSILCFKKKEIK
ncbi:ABC transporter permease subunit [Clostridium sp. PL3]|uniref:ABC transporter permease subunit n=1 Tax=Clostridium thailandense TaxID=2794346 RepID=A0A949TXG7_9CLOT|nr:ABC transporter permease subunit [Clostridium thailandense]MBV7273355.1 ABC transporter permease subunit [Clostridium thailandense]